MITDPSEIGRLVNPNAAEAAQLDLVASTLIGSLARASSRARLWPQIVVLAPEAALQLPPRSLGRRFSDARPPLAAAVIIH